jgi:thiamine-monophosphate kinase
MPGLFLAPYSQSGMKKRAQNKNRTQRNELALIDEIRRRAEAGRGSRDLGLGVGDDCALLRPRVGEELAVTTDLSLAGRHFRLDWHRAEVVGHRALARGLSDLAAMGARPVAAFLSLALPRELTQRRGGGTSWADRFFDGFFQLAEKTGTPLAGGDLCEAGTVLADIVLIGAVPAGRALLRSGARPGDGIYVTGGLGGAAVGLSALEAEAARRGGSKPPAIPRRLEAVLAPHLYPQPRLAVGRALARRGLATAAMDLSDGLSTDLARLCRESGVAAEIQSAALPVACEATLDQALNGGEDYELLFTARPTAKMPRRIGGVPITRIGTILKTSNKRPQVTLVGAEGARALDSAGWRHFA